MIPRPVRNNNPGDLNAGDHWQGLMPADQLSSVQQNERFAVFQSPKWGFRALVVLLTNYRQLYSANTVRRVITRFAPPAENNSDSYINFVSRQLNTQPDEIIDTSVPGTMFKLAKAIATEETGCWAPYWTDDELIAGMSLAGYEAEV